MVRDINYFVPAVANPLAPVTFVDKVHVPVYLACQFTDEQTGGHCADLAQHFTGARRKWFTFTNGVHADSLDPQTFNRWYDFMELYVAHRQPQLSDATKALAPAVFSVAMGINGVTLRPDPIQSEPTFGAALSAFQALKPIRVLFDNGAGATTAGAPYPAFEQSFSRFPIPGTQARSWYLTTRGTLTSGPPSTGRADEFTWRPGARSATSFNGSDDGSPGGLWTATPSYHWQTNPAGTAASYVSAPLAADTTVIGGGAVQLWIKATAPSVDLQATISEVRPDGRETFVQDGWVRASERKLNAAQSTLLEPVLSLAPRRRVVPAGGPLHRGHGAPVLRGPCVPHGVAHPRHHCRPRGRPAPLGILGAESARDGKGVHRPLAQARLTAGAAGRAGGERADRVAALSGPARRAVSRL